MENLVSGPAFEIPEKRFGDYVFQKMSLPSSKEKKLINAETDEGITIEDFHLKCINIAISLKRYVDINDKIACICENEFLSAIPIIASLYLGTTIAIVNPAYNLRELLHNFKLTQPKLIFCKRSVLQNVLDAQKELNFIETIILMDEDDENGFTTIYDLMEEKYNTDNFKPTPVDQSKAALILSSSGTSGLPKGVMISHSNLIASLPYLEDVNYVGMTSETIFLDSVPMFHILGLYLTLYGIIFKSKLVFLKAFRPESFLKAIEDYKVSILVIVPPLAIFLAKSPLIKKFDLSSVEDILCGAAALPETIYNLLYSRLNIKVRRLYGLTEAGLITLVTKNSTYKPNSTGDIIHNLSIILKDPETKKILPKSSKGEICIKGPTVFKSYINNLKETNNSFDENGYLLTGDIGYFDESNQLYIIDRIKDLIKYKGFQVAPTELESLLLTHPAVKDVAVIGIPDERAGELPCAVIVKQPNCEVTEDELANFLKGKVAPYKELKGGVRFIDDIPKNSNGKIMKREIRNMINSIN